MYIIIFIPQPQNSSQDYVYEVVFIDAVGFAFFN